MTATTPKEKGIIFTAEMVRAILDGRKTMTRRLVKKWPNPSLEHPGRWLYPEKPGRVWATNEERRDIFDANNNFIRSETRHIPVDEWMLRFCPFKVGQRLWVREAWAKDMMMTNGVRYYATDDVSSLRKKRSPMLMPRWASRIDLEVTAIRCERVQDITVEDVWREGLRRCIYRHGAKLHIHFCDDGPDAFVPDPVMPDGGRVLPPIAAYHELFDAINGPGSFEDNPWVWAISFRRIEVTP